MNATISNEQEKVSKSKASLMEMTLKVSLLKKLTYAYVRAREMTPSHNIIEVFSNDSTRSLQFEHCDAITRFFNISAFLLLHTLQKNTHHH